MQLDEKTNLFRKTNKKLMLKTLLLYVLVVVCATALIRYLVGDMIDLGIIFGREMFALVLLVTQAISLFLTLTKTISTLYTNNDNDLLMSMPVTPNEVFISKLMVIYVTDFISNVIYTLPIFLTFSICGKMGSAFEFTFIPMLIILPLISLSLSVLFSLPAYIVSNYLKKHTVIAVIVILICAALGIYFYSEVISGATAILNITGQQIQSITLINSKIADTSKWNLFFIFITDCMRGKGMHFRFPIIIIISVAILLLGILISKPFYFKLALTSEENGASEDTKIYKVKKGYHNAKESLLVKEFKTTFRSPGYIFQYFIFTLLMPVIVVIYDKIMLNITLSSIGKNMVDGAHLIVISLIAMMSNIISTSAISREGSNFYYMKIAPVDSHIQCYIKIIFNAILTIGAVIITNTIASIFYSFKWWKCILQIVSISLVSIGHICICFTFDLLDPSLDWFDSNEIETLSKSALRGMIVGLILAAALGLILLLNAGNLLKAYLILIGFSAIFCFICIHMLKLRISYYFKRMEV